MSSHPVGTRRNSFRPPQRQIFSCLPAWGVSVEIHIPAGISAVCLSHSSLALVPLFLFTLTPAPHQSSSSSTFPPREQIRVSVVCPRTRALCGQPTLGIPAPCLCRGQWDRDKEDCVLWDRSEQTWLTPFALELGSNLFEVNLCGVLTSDVYF